MSRSAFDISLLEAVKPQEVKSYLESHGWIQQEQIGNKASIWIQPCEDGDEFEVLVPLLKELRDYSANISTLIETLEIAEQRSQIEILNDLTNYSADILRVRVNTPKTFNGRIPFIDGLKFSHGVKDLIISNVKAKIKPEAYFETKENSSKVDRYLENLQMGHEKGSYVLDIISPLPSQTTLDFGEEISDSVEPFARSTMKQLARSLQIVQNLAERVSSNEIDVDHFLEVVSQGVSANLCDAIVEIDKSGECRGVDIKLSWSPIFKIGNDVPTAIFLSRNIIPIIERAAKRLKSIHKDNFELRGIVINLHRLPDTKTGKVIVKSNIDNKNREVAVQLQDEDYEIAVQAHIDKRVIVCHGELSREGKTFNLLNPRQVSIASDEN
jgi:hypothetical protein